MARLAGSMDGKSHFAGQMCNVGGGSVMVAVLDDEQEPSNRAPSSDIGLGLSRESSPAFRSPSLLFCSRRYCRPPNSNTTKYLQ